MDVYKAFVTEEHCFREWGDGRYYRPISQNVYLELDNINKRSYKYMCGSS